MDVFICLFPDGRFFGVFCTKRALCKHFECDLNYLNNRILKAGTREVFENRWGDRLLVVTYRAL